MAKPLKSLDTIRAINTAVICKRNRRPETYNIAPARHAMVGNAAARRAAILELDKNGVDIDEIAQRVGISRRTVQRIRSDAGLTRSARYATEDEKLRAKAMLSDGASYEEVARTLGRYGSTIASWFPGYAWSFDQRREAAMMAREMANLERP